MIKLVKMPRDRTMLSNDRSNDTDNEASRTYELGQPQEVAPNRRQQKNFSAQVAHGKLQDDGEAPLPSTSEYTPDLRYKHANID